MGRQLELAVLRRRRPQTPSPTLVALFSPIPRVALALVRPTSIRGVASNPTQPPNPPPQVLEEFPSQTAEYVEKGDPKLIKFFIGQAMRKSRGKANPKVVQPLMKKLLDKH